MKSQDVFTAVWHNVKIAFLTGTFVVTSFAASAVAYDAPIGIPDPGMWGAVHPIDSTAPAVADKCPNWPRAENQNCYYVDNTNPAATDSGNIYGYPDKPRLTIPGVTYSAGAYVEIHGGPYAQQIDVSFRGTADRPVWFRGVEDSPPVFTGKIRITDSSYAFLEYLDCNGGTGGCISMRGLAVNNIAIRNSKFRNRSYPGFSTAAIGSTPDQDGKIHDLVFYNNLFHNLGDWEATADDDFHGINPDLWGRKPPTTQYNIWALNNTGYNISGNLVQFNGDQRDVAVAAAEIPPRTELNLHNFHHLYVGFNYAHHNRQDLCVAKLSTDVIISQNVTHDNFNNAAGHGTGFVFQEGPNYNWIIFNKIYSMDFGVRQSNMYYPEFQQNKTFIVGNVIYNIRKGTASYSVNNRYKVAQGIGFEKGNHKRYIIDNTIFDAGGGVNATTAVATDLAEMSGNVIAGINGVDDLGRTDFHVTRLVAEGTVALNRMFFQPRADNGLVSFLWQKPDSIVTYKSLTDFQGGEGQCAECWDGDPLFADPSAYDFHPQKNSPLVGKGVRHPVYDEFEARYGISIAVDCDGKPRPSGAWSLGAYEPYSVLHIKEVVISDSK